MKQYQWEELVGKSPTLSIDSFKFHFGAHRISSPNSEKQNTLIQIYTGDYDKDIYLIGCFNNWGKSLNNSHKFAAHGKFHKIITDQISHRDSYLILTENKYLRDPASVYFDRDGNSIFWDFNHQTSYKSHYKLTNNIGQSTKILQSDLPGLIYHYKGQNGIIGKDIKPFNFYKFIAESGVIDKIKELGFNAIQFLPISQSIDGNKWSYRYLVPFIYAIDNKWGDPNSFKYMVDMFHKSGIQVILDHVISHAPDRDFRIFKKDAKEIGIHIWDDTFNIKFLGESTSWGSKRYNYEDEYIRTYLNESALHFIKYYDIDGFRIDNVDGILRYGENGNGPERPYGRIMMRGFNSQIYTYAPETIISLESHHFYNENAKLLSAPIKSDKKALGATAYTSSRLTYYLHSEYMPKSADDISPWKFQELLDEKLCGGSNSTISDFHNHDAAAGLMAGRATGSYAYDALILGDKKLQEHAIGKIKVMEALISFWGDGRTLDLIQTHLLQTGSFEHDTSIKWHLEDKYPNGEILEFKQAVNNILSDQAFWPKYINNRKITNIDEGSKSLVISRSSNSNDYIVFINLSSFTQTYFKIPAPQRSQYQLILNSDSRKYAGTGLLKNIDMYNSQETNQFEFFKHSLIIDYIPAYSVLVWQRIKPW